MDSRRTNANLYDRHLEPTVEATEICQGNDEPLVRLAYSITDVVKASGLSRSLLYIEMAAGRLVAHKAGKRTVILASDLHEWLANLPKSYDKQSPVGRKT